MSPLTIEKQIKVQQLGHSNPLQKCNREKTPFDFSICAI
jgi:hypothetical protein